MAGDNPFLEFGGNLLSDNTTDPFSSFGGKKLQPPLSKQVPSNMPVDNLKVINPQKPLSNSNTDIQNSKNIHFNNLNAIAAYNYYHPELRNVTSGDPKLDFLYKNQWLMDVPGIGGLIKNQAYNMAKQSNGTSVRVGNTENKYNPKNSYTGNLDVVSNGANAANKAPSLVDQYFGKINLPASKYKPTSDYLSFLPSVSIKGDFDKFPKNYDLKNVFSEINMTDEEKKNLYEKARPIYRRFDSASELSKKLNVDLGGHTVGVGFDKEIKKPYIAIADAWDFSPKDYAERYGSGSDSPNPRMNPSFVEASLMHKAGKPFKVYDRFYFDPKTNQYIPDKLLPMKKK